MLTTLPPSCADVMKSENLNFLQPSGPLQACNGTDLHFTFNCMYKKLQDMKDMKLVHTSVTVLCVCRLIIQ